MKLIKLTDKDGMTNGILTWGPGVTHVVKKTQSPKLCSADVIHAYKHLNLAILLNPIGADYQPFRIWEAEGDIAVEDWSKAGCFKLMMIRELSTPKWFLDEDKRKKVLVCFAVLCAEKVLKIYEDKYPNDDRPRKAIEEAKKYLNGTMTSRVASCAAADVASCASRASYAAARAASCAAAGAYYAASYAAAGAYYAASCAAAGAYYAASCAAADAADVVADAAARADININFSELAEEAVKMYGL
jgi:hypothetical protein